MTVRFALVLFLLLSVASGCKKEQKAVRDPQRENKVAAREVTLFFESPELMLAPEKRTLSLPERESAALSAVTRELIKGSVRPGVPKLFPADAVVRAVYSLPDGTAIVDIGSASLGSTWNPGTHGELMALYSVVQTLSSNFGSVKRVRFLVNGQVAETLAGHIRLDRPLRPLPSIVSLQSVPAAVNTAAIPIRAIPDAEGGAPAQPRTPSPSPQPAATSTGR